MSVVAVVRVRTSPFLKYILKVGSIEFAEKLDMGCGREESRIILYILPEQLGEED